MKQKMSKNQQLLEMEESVLIWPRIKKQHFLVVDFLSLNNSLIRDKQLPTES